MSWVNAPGGQFGKRLSQINCVNCSGTNARSSVQDDDMSESRTDPAQQNGYLRCFYRDWRPTRLGRIFGRVLSWLSGLGLMPRILLTLRVKGRSSGRLRSTILVVANHDGRHYLVSMLGDNSEWVRNVRAASGEAFIKRGRSVPITLTEILSKERAPIFKAWCQAATSGRHHLPVPGALYAPFAGFANTELLFWLLSGQVLIMVIVGGAGTLIGPMLGAAFFLTVEHQLSNYTEAWALFFGLIFIAFVIFAPEGIWGIIRARFRRRTAVESEYRRGVAGAQ